MVVLRSRVRVRVRYDKILGERGLIRMGWDNTHEERRVVVIFGIGLGENRNRNNNRVSGPMKLKLLKQITYFMCHTSFAGAFMLFYTWIHVRKKVNILLDVYCCGSRI